MSGGKTEADKEAEKIQRMVESARKLSDEFNRSQEFNLKMQKSQDAMLGLTRDQQAVQGAVNDVLRSTNQQLEKIVKLRFDAVNGINFAPLRPNKAMASAVFSAPSSNCANFSVIFSSASSVPLSCAGSIFNA